MAQNSIRLDILDNFSGNIIRVLNLGSQNNRELNDAINIAIGVSMVAMSNTVDYSDSPGIEDIVKYGGLTMITLGSFNMFMDIFDM